jgi:serine/threonine-protein kinase
MNPIAQLSAALADRYAIERELGAGGMATVYLARDVRHDRQVALKVLKPELGAVLGVERFLSEIRVTAHLSHPNLLPLFDSGETDGLLFYVMPYVVGETLRARLNREQQLPVDDAVRIASAIASALDYAHGAGVVHRDLKPENILFQAGQPVVADFGIALAVSNAGGTRVTQTGLSLGTPQYMSPEQATGDRVVDGRSDIYSLGAVTYEMLTGEPPHSAPTAHAIIAKLLTEEVRPVTALRKTVPVHVDAAIRRALEKLPADRWATAREFSDVLLGRVAPPPTTTGSAVRAPRTESPAQKRDAWLFVAVAAIVSAALTASVAALIVRSRDSRPREPVRFVLNVEPGEQLANSVGAPFALSPDGRLIAYAASRGNSPVRLYIRSINALQARPLEGTEGAAQLTFSPDGRWIAFVTGSELKKVTVDGGAVVVLSPMSGGATRGICWATMDTIFVGSVSAGIKAVGSHGAGTPRVRFTPPSSTYSLRWPVLLDDGKTIAFIAYRGGAAGQDYWTASLTGGAARPLLHNGSILTGGQPLGVVDGRLVFVDQAGALSAIKFDVRRSEILGPLATVSDHVLYNLSTTSAKAALSPSGSLVYQSGQASVKPVLVDVHGRETPLGIDSGAYGFPRFSPDGRRVAFTISSGGSGDIWVYDRGAQTMMRLTNSSGVVNNDRPEWSRDGKRILFRSTTGHNALWWISTDGSGREELVQSMEASQVPEGAFSPTAEILAVRTLGDATKDGIFYRDLSGDTALKPLSVVAGAYPTTLRFSPDGKWLAYSSEESGIRQVYVTPFPAGGSHQAVSVDGGDEPVWSPDGRHIYYAHGGRQVVDAAVTLSPSFSVSRRVLFEGNYVFQYLHQNFDITPDGTTFLMLKPNVDAKTVVVHDWVSELRGR